jgi:hypothetical protein
MYRHRARGCSAKLPWSNRSFCGNEPLVSYALASNRPLAVFVGGCGFCVLAAACLAASFLMAWRSPFAASALAWALIDQQRPSILELRFWAL